MSSFWILLIYHMIFLEKKIKSAVFISPKIESRCWVFCPWLQVVFTFYFIKTIETKLYFIPILVWLNVQFHSCNYCEGLL